MIMLNTVIVALIAALATSSSVTEARCPCWSDGGKMTNVICDDANLKFIPDCVPSNVTMLSVSTPSIPLVAETFIRFTKLPQLQILWISNPQMSKDTLKYMSNLKSFTIMNTGLDYVDNEWFMYAPHIKTLVLFYNKLTYLAPDTFIYLPLLETVNLNNNQLASLSPEIFQGTALKTLKLDNNPWHCDCEMAKFIQWTRANGVKIEDEPLCAQPIRLRGLNVKDLTLSQACTRSNN